MRCNFLYTGRFTASNCLYTLILLASSFIACTLNNCGIIVGLTRVHVFHHYNNIHCEIFKQLHATQQVSNLLCAPSESTKYILSRLTAFTLSLFAPIASQIHFGFNSYSTLLDIDNVQQDETQN